MKNIQQIFSELSRIAETRENQLLKMQMRSLINDLQLHYALYEHKIDVLRYIQKLNDKCNGTRYRGTTPTAPQWLENYYRQTNGKQQME